jgi:hypothetical protein
LSDWKESRGRVRFSDPAAGREYVAEVDDASLGGTWRTAVTSGGWWCTATDGGSAAAEARPPSPAGLMTALVPVIMASPNYPRQAVREAKEGRAIGCFAVYGSGAIGKARVLEVSDELFRGPVLAAIRQSRYRPWGETGAVLPACRSYTFELDTVR